MANITKAQERALSLAFRAVDVPEDQQKQIKADLNRHGVVRDTAQQWHDILARLDERTERLVRFEIRVGGGVAQQLAPSLVEGLARNAARFAEQPPQTPQTETQPPEPVSETPPVSEINTEAVNAWLAETGIKDMEVVGGLTSEQRDTLARIAQINRRTAYLLVTHRPLTNMAGPGEILDRVRTLMRRGSRDWIRLFDDAGIFSNEPRFIRRALRILDAAARTAATASARGLKIKSSITDIQWSSLPQEARIFMERRLRPYVDKRTPPIETMARTATLDIISPGDEVVEVITTSRTSPAFGISDTKEFFARRQIRPFQLLLAAKTAEARSVRFVLYGEPLFDERYAEKLREAARELQLGVLIVHADYSTGETRYLLGETPMRPEAKGAPDKQMPPLPMPRRFKMKAPPPVQTEAVTPLPDRETGTFADYFNAESADQAVFAWVVAMRRTYNNASLPSGVRDVIGRLLGQEGRSIIPEAGLRMLDEAVWKEMEGMFSRLDRTDAATKTLLERIPEGVGPRTFEEAYTIREALADAREEFEALKLDVDDIGRNWETLQQVGELVHPERIAGLIGETLGETVDLYGETYLPLDERLQAIEARLLASEAGLSEAMMSISVRDFLTSARGKTAKAEEAITALRRSAEEARRLAEELAVATAEQVVPSDRLFDTAGRAHAPFPELAGVAELRTELAETGREAGRYKDIAGGGPGFAEELEGVRAETERLLGEIPAIQAEYDLAKADHAGVADRLRQWARGMELSLVPTDNTGLPPPLEISEYGSRTIEGKGHLRLKYSSPPSKLRRINLRDSAFESFESARALIVRGKTYLVDSKAVAAVSKWLGTREGDLILTDLLGQEVHIPRHHYGVRMVKVGDLKSGHPFVLISKFIRGRYVMSSSTRDFMLTLLSSLSDPAAAGIWRRLISTAVKIMHDHSDANGDVGLEASVLARFEIDHAIVSLYEDVMAVPYLASLAERWFRFGDLDVTIRGEFRPISNETLARLEEMSLEEMTRVIEATGLLPAERDDRTAWVNGWMKAIERRSPSSLTTAWDGFAEWFGRLQKRAKYLPEPYKFVGAIMDKADHGDVLVLRMAVQGFFAERDAGKRMDDMDHARFAIRFLAEHQHVIADLFRSDVRNEPDEFQWSDEDPLALLAGRAAFAGRDIGFLATLGREFLRLRGTLTQQVGEILVDAVAAMFGRILMHRDALMISHFARLIADEAKNLPNIQRYLAEVGPSREVYGQETVESHVFDGFSSRWPFFERMLALAPIELIKVSADIERAIEAVRRGGGGGAGGAPGGAGGTPNGGGGFTTSGSDPGPEPGGFEPVGEDEGGQSAASFEGLSDGAEIYLQAEAEAMGVASPSVIGATPLAIPLRPVTRF